MKGRNHTCKALLAFLLALMMCVSVFVGCNDDPVDTTTDGTTTAEPEDDGTTTTEPEDDGTTTTEPEDDGTTTTEPEDDGTTTTSPEDGEDTNPPASVIDAISPTHGATVCVANAKVQEFVSNYTAIGMSKAYIGSGDIYAPLPITLKWEDVGADAYRVRLATSADFADSQVVLTAANEASFHNPFTGTRYYWQVEALYADRTDASAIFTFKTAKTPRTVYIEGVPNSRDIGGYAVSDNAVVRQGMIYRSGYLHKITEAGIYEAREMLGIKCELDLRTPGEGGAGVSSSLGEDITYYNYNGVYYGGIKNKDLQAILAQEIKVFANPDNYPMIVHCSVGRDRTGTASMLVLALCGVSEQDLYMDYELSFFSDIGSNDTVENLLDNHVTPMVNYLKTFGKRGDSLQTCVENFCLKIGVTQEEINSIRTIMIEEVK